MASDKNCKNLFLICNSTKFMNLKLIIYKYTEDQYLDTEWALDILPDV